MLTRILTSFCMAAVGIPALIFSDSVYFIALLLFCSVLAEFELLRCMGLHKNIPISVVVYFLGSGGPLGARYAVRYFSETSYYASAFIVSAVATVIILSVFTFSKGKVTLEQAGTVAAVSEIIAAAFSSLVLIADMQENGKFLIVFVLIGAWITDTCAYFTGVFFGKHKLIPEISPKKTVEGSIGGIIGCTVAFVLYGIIYSSVLKTGVKTNYLSLIVSGILASLIAQAGDLFMSAIKRNRGIKDYGKIFPGHGGILDRFDSVISVSLMVFLVEEFTNLL